MFGNDSAERRNDWASRQMTSELRGVSSATRTLDARDLAAMRPAAAPKPRAPRKKADPALRQVARGIVCFCGERFAESQALEFMRHLRADVGETLDWAERERQKSRMYERRYRSRPEVRERIRAYSSKRSRELWKDPEYRRRERERKASPEYREGRRQYSRERYRNPEYREQARARKKDPEYRERDREYQRERIKDPEVRRLKLEYQREYNKRPEVRERKAAAARERRASKKAEREGAEP